MIYTAGRCVRKTYRKKGLPNLDLAGLFRSAGAIRETVVAVAELPIVYVMASNGD
jgi:hypothetical protein